MFKVFVKFHEKGIMNAKTNNTLLCLIPKIKDSIQIKDFRSISLVSSLYKIIAKVLSNRLGEVIIKPLNLNNLLQ